LKTVINPAGRMNKRDRFLNVFKFQEVDHVPDVEFGYWTGTLRRWRSEGLPNWVTDDVKANTFFSLEGRRSEIPVGEKVPLGFHDLRAVVPFRRFESEILSEDKRSYTVSQAWGALASFSQDCVEGILFPDISQFMNCLLYFKHHLFMCEEHGYEHCL